MYMVTGVELTEEDIQGVPMKEPMESPKVQPVGIRLIMFLGQSDKDTPLFTWELVIVHCLFSSPLWCYPLGMWMYGLYGSTY